MNYKNIIVAVAVSLALTSCGLYKKYESETKIPANIMGVDVPDSSAVGGITSLAQMSWRQFFTDPLLQQLIEQALANNTDLASARILVEQSTASLKAARLGYLPAFTFAPQGTLSSFDRSPVTKTYSKPLQMDWDIELFGSITNKKRAAEAVVLQAQCSEDAVRSNLVSAIAQHYSMLQALDRQLEILIQTDSLWSASLETQKSLWENGKAYSTAVNQMESSWLNVKTQIVEVRGSILYTEIALCKLLAIPTQRIARNKWGAHDLSTSIANGGFSAEMLRNRPDIRLAEHMLEEAYYNTQIARAAFYPTLTLSGTLGWTNNAGGTVVDPGKLLLNIMGQLTQPIFTRGQLNANLKIAKLTQQDLLGTYTQTVIDAGNEVNQVLADFQAAVEKDGYYSRQVATLHDAYTGTHELMDNGKANYLEVLTAQESLLSAQLSEAMNKYYATQAIIALYIALGGGSK